LLKGRPLTFKQHFRKFRVNLGYLPRAVALVWASARIWTVAWAGLLLVQGILPLAIVYLTREVVDALVHALRSGGDWTAIRPALISAGLVGGTLLLEEVLRRLGQWVRTVQSELVQDHVMGLIHSKAISLDMAFFETSECYDQLYRARVDSLTRPALLVENIGALIQNGITLAVMAAVLVTYAAWLPAVLFAGTLPAAAAVGWYALQFNQWRIRNTMNERRVRYYDWLLTQHEHVPELRLFDVGTHYKEAYQQLRRELRTERVGLARQQMLAEIAAGGIALMSGGLAVAWMAWRAVRGAGTLGDVALFYQVFNQGQRLMRTLLENAGEMYRGMFFLENLFEFLQNHPQLVEPTKPVRLAPMLGEGIRFQAVSFRYPGSSRQALRDLDLEIPAGRVVALVGDNGAGKSTIIKLLCRFYDPEAGRITLDGEDIRELSVKELRRRVTVLFQQPLHYQATVAENIAPNQTDSEAARAEIERAAIAAGADGPILRLPEGYYTVLGKWFGGAELSVGEWQRLALARAFFRRADIVVLDEPTSAMDSWAEADWLNRFRTLVAGRTALIITHRFTTAMKADIIHVVEAGHVIESGTHNELVALGGRYGQSWKEQIREAGEVCLAEQMKAHL
jgi:ATP-binding cassette, subfamily B, bacterial